MKTITAERLEQLRACEEAVADFRKLLGESCEVDERNVSYWIRKFGPLTIAYDDFRWLLEKLLDRKDAVTTDTIAELERYLEIEPRASFRERIGDIIHELLHMDDERIAKAMVEILGRLPDL